jgi:excisionase family DNA binding protein
MTVSKKEANLIEELRAMLPDTPEAQALVERVREAVHPDRLLTTREAADFLGVRSVNTLKALLIKEAVPTVKVGSHTRVAKRDLERLHNSRSLDAMRESDQKWDEIDEAFGSEGLTQSEMDALSDARPGTLPWKKKRSERAL